MGRLSISALLYAIDVTAVYELDLANVFLYQKKKLDFDLMNGDKYN